MKKLKLDLDTLRVQSFATSAAKDGARGTVRGHVYADAEAEGGAVPEDGAGALPTHISGWDCFTYTCFCGTYVDCSRGCPRIG